MRKEFIYFISILLLDSCNVTENKNVYQDADKKYLITAESQGGAQNDTLFTFYNYENPAIVEMVGFTKDGFRNGTWNYNLKTNVETIKWAPYKDKYLEFKTNVFAYTDSVKHGEWFTKFLYKIKNERLILSISINGPLKDSLPELNYSNITKRELTGLGAKVNLFETKKVVNKNRNIYLVESSITKRNGYVMNLKGAYGFIDSNHFIEISVTSEKTNSFYQTELFNAILANFYLRGMRFYYP